MEGELMIYIELLVDLKKIELFQHEFLKSNKTFKCVLQWFQKTMTKNNYKNGNEILNGI